jgi:hypothetical protein
MSKEIYQTLLDCVTYYRIQPDFKEFANTYKELVEHPNRPLFWKHFLAYSEPLWEFFSRYSKEERVLMKLALLAKS